jgi:nucleotidyltransferase/DNA polymerase involved in DNA repair
VRERSDTFGSPTPEASAPAMRALDELAAVLTRTSTHFERLAERARALRGELADGMGLTQAMGAEPRPLIITRMTQLLDELTTAARAVRRTEAEQLRREGLSQQAVAEVFGVSRQRVAALLAAPVEDRDGHPRTAHRPARREPSG